MCVCVLSIRFLKLTPMEMFRKRLQVSMSTRDYVILLLALAQPSDGAKEGLADRVSSNGHRQCIST